MGETSESTSILFRAGSTLPGVVHADITKRVESIFLNEDDPPEAFGDPCKYDDSTPRKVRSIETGDSAADVCGFMCRTTPSIAGSLTNEDSLTEGVLNPLYAKGLLKEGMLGVKCRVGTPVRGGNVYMRVVEDGVKKVGHLEATSDVEAADAAMVGTGNATIADVVVDEAAESGVYTVLMTAATKFNLQTPSGAVLKQGTLGVEYSAGGLTFTATAGATPAVAGDTIAITVTANTVNLTRCKWAVDGKDDNDCTAIRVNLD